MPETFSTRQLAVIAATNKTVSWLFRITDNQATPVTYYWSTGTQASGNGSIDIGAQLSPGVYAGSEWEYAHTFKIINFSGVTLRRSKSESGIHAPNDVSFSIINPTVGGNPTYAASNFKGGIVRIALVVDDDLGKQIIGSWRFVIKSASPYNQQIDVTCEDFLQQYLRGTYPNTRLVSDIFKADTDNTIIDDNVVVPEVYGEAYIPLRSIYASPSRYYLLGPSTGKTYTISEIRNPRATGAKITWTNPAYAMTQATKTATDATTWRVFQPIIAASVPGGAADSPGLWLNGDTFYDLPTKFSEASTVLMTNPADIIRRVLINMGVSDADIDVTAARLTFASWGLAWNFAFWYQEDRVKVLSRLLTMCHSCLVIGEKVRLQVLSAISVKTITSVEVTKPQEDGPSSFKYTDALSERLSDSGYMTWQQTGESQDQFLKYLVPAYSATDWPDSTTVEITAVQDSVQAQRLTSLHLQRLLGKVGDIGANLKGTCLILRPDDVVAINYVDFGGSYNALLDEVTINQDCSLSIRGLVFSEALDDWADVTPSAITVATDTTTGAYQVVTVGLDSPGATNLPNALPGRLRIGQTQDYIVLDPTLMKIALYEMQLMGVSEVERVRFGNLSGYPGLYPAGDLFGIALGDVASYLTWDKNNGLRISGALSAGTISIGASPNWLRVDATGNLWLGADLFADAPFSVTPAGVLKAQSGTFGGWTLGATTLTGTGITLSSTGNASLAIGTTPPTSPTAGTGIFVNKTGLFGLDANNQRFKLGTDGSGFLGAATTISWTTVGVVTVAGFTTGTTDLTKTASGNTTIVSSGATAFTAGPTGAPTFTVTQAGVLNATGVTVSGAITATTGSIGSFTIGTYLYTGTKTAYNDANAGVHIGSDGIGIGNNIFTVSAAGALIATSATITGAINANTGTIGGATNYWNITAGKITAAGTGLIETASAAVTGIKLDSTSLRGYNGTVQTVNIATDGSGWMGLTGTKAIQWTTAGVVSLGNWTVNASSIQTGAFNTNGTMYFGTSGISLSDTFKVTAAGALTATGVTVSGAITATSGTFTGTVNAASGTIGGWILAATLLQSAATGAARIELDQSAARITVKDATNASKTVMGYLNALAKHDGTGNWGTGDYGFWAAAGDKLVIDGDANYKSGDWIVENDGAYLIQNAAAQTIIRLGTVSAVKGLYIYDATSPTQNLLAKFATDGLYLGTAGSSDNYLAYTVAGGLVIKGAITITSGSVPNASVTGLGSLALKSAVDLATAEVTNKTAGNITYTGGATVDSLKPAAAGADVTSANTAANAASYTGSAIATTYTAAKNTNPLADQTSINTAAYIAGQAATATSSDFASVTGVTKPADNATVGATWGTNLGSIPATLGAPAGDGLYLSSTYMGFYKSAAWKTYIDNAGNLVLGDIAGGNTGLSWNQGAGTLTIKGAITATSGTFTGMVSGSYVYGSSLMTKGTYLSSTCLAAATTLNVGDTTDFAASGSASFIDSANDRDAFTYTGKTGTTLTGCSGVVAHTVSSTNKPLVIPTVQGMYISGTTNEMSFWGNRGDGTVEELASIGLSSAGSDTTVGTFGSNNSQWIGVYGKSSTNTAVFGHSVSGWAVVGRSESSYSVYSDGTTYLGGNVDIFTTSYLGLGVAKGRIIFTDTTYPTANTISFSTCDVLPGADNTQNFGSAALRWANIYTADLNLRNDRGDYTLIEESYGLTVRNNKTKKLYSINMTEIN